MDGSGRDEATGSSDLEKADIAVARAVAPVRKTLPVRVLGRLSELSDQPPLIALAAGTFGYGLLRGDRRLAETGGRMLSAHLLATAIKSAVKARIIRTRPQLLVEHGDYRMHAGNEDAHPVNSFPSGHTAGAVAVARAVARGHPDRRAAAYGLAGAAAVMQIPRCAHYPSDVGVGAAIGIAAEALIYAGERLLGGWLTRRQRRSAVLSTPVPACAPPPSRRAAGAVPASALP